MQQYKLFMLLLGCKPAGRNTEQHDIFFGIGISLKELKPQIEKFWSTAGKLHIDGWREINNVDGYPIKIIPSQDVDSLPGKKLFFLNLGGYKKNEFEEYHYKLLTVSTDKGQAIKQARQTAFYKHTGFKGAESHIDEKYGVDVDDIYQIEDILSPDLKQHFHISIEQAITGAIEDDIHLGYFQLHKL